MPDADQTMFTNLEEKTGHGLDEWFGILDATGLEKHTALMNHLKQSHGVTHGFANGIALLYRSRGTSQAEPDLVDAQYDGPKAAMRPVYTAIVHAVSKFGADVEVAPKKSGVSLRRSKQFAVIEVPSAKRIQLGIQLKGDEPTERLLPGNAMCSHRVSLTSINDLDDELLGWLREAYSRA